MRIQHNIPAMNAYRNYNNNTKALSGNLEKLSSGYKINRAGDDAAGLAISEKMRAQITGLNAAQKNVKDGVSLVKTAEGAMQEIQDMLNRMKYLATQSANGTYQDDVDRDNLQKEVQSLRAEINRIADSANFNGIKLLDGSLSTEGRIGGGTSTNNISDLMETSLPAPDASDYKTGDAVTAKGDPTNGSTAADAKPATVTITLGAASSANVLNTQVTYGGTQVSVSDLFDVKSNEGGKLVLEAKVGGKMGSAFETNLKAALSAGAAGITTGVTVTDGANKGAGAPAGAASYEFSFGGTISGGDTIQFGGKTFEFVTDSAASGTNVAVTIGTSAASTAENLTAAMSAQLTKGDKSGWDIEVTAVSGGGYKVTATAQTAGLIDAAKVGEVSSSIEGFERGDVEMGSAAGSASSSGSASVTYTIDTSKVTAGDVIQIGDRSVKVIAGTTDLAKGEIKLSELTSKLASAFADYEGGKVSVSGNDITITSYQNGKLDDDALAAFASSNEVKHLQGMSEAEVAASKAPGTDGNDVTPTLGDDKKTYTSAIGAGLDLTDFATAADTDTIGETAAANFAKLTNVTVGKDITVDLSKAGITKDTTVAQAKEKIATAVKTALTAQDTKGVYDANSVTVKAASVSSQADAATTTNGFEITLATKEEVKDDDPGEDPGNDPAAAGENKPLRLQIGDTSHDYNQMKVSIGDMHTDAMGQAFKATTDDEGVTTYQREAGDTIDTIDINDQDGARTAIDVITNAINYVSSVRGDLGAIQNRLEHTQKNLSVMAENIQDAESTIRDTDVAEEMMSYVKNNILVQSAQAMLAQANQLPQGVLQLLG